jgi:hypothetical protein
MRLRQCTVSHPRTNEMDRRHQTQIAVQAGLMSAFKLGRLSLMARFVVPPQKAYSLILPSIQCSVNRAKEILLVPSRSNKHPIELSGSDARQL